MELTQGKNVTTASGKSKKSSEDSSLEAFAAASAEFTALSAGISNERFARVRDIFARLCLSPPQVTMLEGGSAGERIGAALYLAASLNCENIEKATIRPCLACESCRLFISGEHRDLCLLDGRKESIKIDAVRALRVLLGQAAHSARWRVVVLAEAQFLVEAAANALLKSLEEPQAGTVFILCAPQRRRLLPTLVSRSWVLTLPWLHPHQDLAGVTTASHQSEDMQENLARLEQALLKLLSPESALAHASSWMTVGAQKGSIDKHLALHFVTHCRRHLCAGLAFGQGLTHAAAHGESFAPLGLPLRRLPVLAHLFSGLSADVQWDCAHLLDETEEALLQGISPVLSLDRMAVRLFLLWR